MMEEMLIGLVKFGIADRAREKRFPVDRLPSTFLIGAGELYSRPRRTC
jgi:hypothetical protein